MKLALFCLALVPAFVFGSYIPPYIEGVPLSMAVTDLDPPDIRGVPVYRINIEVTAENGDIIAGITHRSYEEFQKLDERLREDELDFADLVLPAEEEANVELLDAYVRSVASSEANLATHLVQDFMGINWSGKDIRFLTSFEDFMSMLLLKRIPEFMPEPPVIDDEDFLAEETPFEIYVYFLAFRHNKAYTAEYLEFFKRYTDATPAFDGPEDDSDVAYPGAGMVNIPYHYNRTAVHFLPGGYLNGHTVRISYLGKTKFSFLDEDLLREWIVKLHGDKSPKRILDVGTGGCFSAFAYGELYPEAEVIGIDLAAPYIRFCRRWKDVRGAENVEFFHASGEDLSIFEDNSFDLINYAYVLHEMPGVNARAVVSEMARVLKPGGTLNGFEVPYIDDPVLKGIYTFSNTWGFDWDEGNFHGPEPYIHEYEYECKLPELLAETGLVDVEVIPFSYFESIFLAKKAEF